MSCGYEANLPDPPEYPELRLDAQLCLALRVCESMVGRLYRELLDPLDLTHPQYLVLLTLWENGRSLMGSIGGALSLETGTVTPLVKRMETAGLVTRVRDTDDERKVWVELTWKGRLLQHEVAAVRREVEERIPLRSAEIEDLRRDLQNMIEKFRLNDRSSPSAS